MWTTELHCALLMYLYASELVHKVASGMSQGTDRTMVHNAAQFGRLYVLACETYIKNVLLSLPKVEGESWKQGL